MVYDQILITNPLLSVRGFGFLEVLSPKGKTYLGSLPHLGSQIVKIVGTWRLDRELYHSLILSWYLP